MKKILIGLGIFLALIVFIIVIVLGSCSSESVKIEDYITVEYVPAYNGYAVPELIIDEDGLDALIDEEKVTSLFRYIAYNNERIEDLYGDADEFAEDMADYYEYFFDFFEVDFAEDYEGLKNGDKIIVNITLNEDFEYITDASVKELSKKLGLNISSNELSFKVKGLEKLKVIDVDLDKLFDIDFGTYDGYATPTVSIDSDYLDTLLVNEVVSEFANSSTIAVKLLLWGGSNTWFDAEFDENYENLENGDKVTVNLVLDEDFEDCGVTLADLEDGLHLNFQGGTKTYTVYGLEEAKNIIDIFEGIEQYINYSVGGNGNGSIDLSRSIIIPDDYSKQIGDLYFKKGDYYCNVVKVIHNNTKIAEISYHISGENLSEGDIVEMTAYCQYPSAITKLGYSIPTWTTNVVMPDFGDYLREQEQLTPDVLAKIKDEINADSISKIYYATYKPGVECEYESTSFIVVIYYKSGWFSSGYYIDELHDIILKPDGTIAVESHYGSYADDTLERAENYLDKNSYEFILLE